MAGEASQKGEKKKKMGIQTRGWKWWEPNRNVQRDLQYSWYPENKTTPTKLPNARAGIKAKRGLPAR